ncbi:MAG: hypothetical protein E7283_08245 [Lachnospiraceae bacterium]|nr:hypothetical protein [Lachnospiraceae bacterium]
MYKKQMILQRIVCYAMLIAAALVFVYSLGIMTDMYDSKFAYYAEDIENPMVAGTEIYYIMQDFNKSLTTAGIMLILLAVTQLVFQNHNRRKYYIANYITVGANTIAVVGVSVWALNNIFTYREMYLQVDFEALAQRAELMKFYWTDSTFWFDISRVVFGVLLVTTVLNVLNLVFKIVVMSAEKKLIAEGKEV